MSQTRSAAKAVCRQKNSDPRCPHGSPMTRGVLYGGCEPCKGCGIMMHSIYDGLAHESHTRGKEQR